MTVLTTILTLLGAVIAVCILAGVIAYIVYDVLIGFRP